MKVKVRTDYDQCEYITAGKVYEARDCGKGLELRDDDGELIYTSKNESSHLDGEGSWEIVEDSK